MSAPAEILRFLAPIPEPWTTEMVRAPLFAARLRRYYFGRVRCSSCGDVAPPAATVTLPTQDRYRVETICEACVGRREELRAELRAVGEFVGDLADTMHEHVENCPFCQRWAMKGDRSMRLAELRAACRARGGKW